MNDNVILSSSPQQNVYGPVTPSQMFERTFALLRENARLFFGIVLVVIGVQIVIGGVMGGSGFWFGRVTAESAPITKALFIFPLSMLGGALIYIFMQIVKGAVFFAAQAKLAHAPMSVGEACKLAAEKIWRMIGISILVGLRILGYLLLFYFAFAIVFFILALLLGGFAHGAEHIPFSFRHGQHLGLGLFMGFVLLVSLVAYVAVLFWLLMRYAVAIPACLAENVSVTEAIRRSIHLTHKSKGRIFALFLTMFGVYIAIAAVTIPAELMMVHAKTAHMGKIPIAIGVISTIFGILWNVLGAVLIAFVGVALTICYYDLRVRKDGFGAPTTIPVVGIPPAAPAATPDWPIGDLPVS